MGQPCSAFRAASECQVPRSRHPRASRGNDRRGRSAAGHSPRRCGASRVPTGVLLLPTGAGLLPTGVGIFPTGAGNVPTGVGLLPTGAGDFATGVGLLPTGAGDVPTGVGLFPTGVGSFPTGVGSVAARNLINSRNSDEVGVARRRWYASAAAQRPRVGSGWVIVLQGSTPSSHRDELARGAANHARDRRERGEQHHEHHGRRAEGWGRGRGQDSHPGDVARFGRMKSCRCAGCGSITFRRRSRFTTEPQRSH